MHVFLPMTIRILHLIAGLNIGGANLFLRRLAAEEKKRGLDSRIIVMMDKGSLGNTIQALGIPIYTLELRRGRPSLRGLMRLQKSIQQLKPDLIHAWMYHGAFAATLSNMIWQHGIPLIWNIRHTPYNLTNERLLTALLIHICAKLSSHADAIVYNAGYSLARHKRLGYHSPRQLVIPNGFDVETFQPNPEARITLRRALGVEDCTPLIGMVARYHPMKDHNTFLKAACLMRHRNPEVHFVLVGRGIDAQNLELTNKITLMELSENIHLLGEQTDIQKILAGLDLLTVTSAWGEGFPNVIGEAMACGVPCVVTDIGDAGFIVAECGRVVEVGDEYALANAWRELLDLNQEQRETLGAKARERILEQFTLPQVVDEYINLYQAVLPQKINP